MNELEIKQKLDQLAEFKSQRDVALLEKQSLIDEILTPEIRTRISEIEAEFSDKTEGVEANISLLESEIKQAVVSLGTSVKGTFFHAVFNKGRVSWDNKALDGYAMAHPELLAFRKEGEPSVSLRVK